MSTDAPPFLVNSPGRFPIIEDEPLFDADRHLSLEMPSGTITLDAFGYDESTIEQCPTDFAMTTPFSVLSPEGAKAMFEVGAAFRSVSTLTEGNPHAAYIKPRGSAYSSRFVRDLWSCTRLSEFFSDIVGIKLIPHPMPSAGAAFIFAPQDPARTNQGWHLDSVGFTCIIALNDPSELEGGAFQYYRGTGEEIAALIGVTKEELRTSVGQLGELPADNVVNVAYGRAGCGLLMQGNHILHRGEPLRASAPRTVFAMSYMVGDVKCPDVTNWREMSKWNSPTLRTEFVRHKAWRTKRLLEQLTIDLSLDDDASTYEKVIDLALAELAEAKNELER